MPEVERLKAFGKLGVGVALGLALKGDTTPPSPPYTGQPSLTGIEVVERTHRFEVVSQRQAYKALGIEMELKNEPQLPTKDQILMISSSLSDMPPKLVDSLYRLRLFIGDLPADCLCSAITYAGGVYIGISRDILNTNNQEIYKPYVNRVMAHELTHKKYFETDPAQIDSDVLNLLGDQDQIRAKLAQHQGDGSPNSDIARDAVYSLLNEGGRRILPEGVARLSELYVSGQDVFSPTLSPYIDAESFYTYIGEVFFGGMEYDANSKPIQK